MTAARAGSRVLVVDDDDLIRDVLSEALDEEGYVVQVAAHGREALAILRAWRPDLILLDLKMPEMDGPTFRAAQRQLPGMAHVPVVVLSASRDAQSARELLQAAQVIEKPFDLGDLLSTIDQLVAE